LRLFGTGQMEGGLSFLAGSLDPAAVDR
jgi:hypothetical protein